MEAIVLDNGSGYSRLAFRAKTHRGQRSRRGGTREEPRVVCIAGAQLEGRIRDRETFVGAECQQYRDFLELSNPINRGIVEDWDALERMWEFVFAQELRVDPETAALPVLCISSPSGSKKQQERMAQLMFESQKVCGFYFIQQCVLSLFASGRTRGLVVEVGHGSSHAIPIFEGYALPHAALHYNAGGVDISHRLHLLLSKRGMSQQGQNQQDEANRLTQTMPAEVLFKPQELGDEHPLRPEKGLHECVAASIAMCDKDLQSDLLNAVVLAGARRCCLVSRVDSRRAPVRSTRQQPQRRPGPSGSRTRLQLAAEDCCMGRRVYVCLLDTFRDIHITKQEWEEYHEAILDRKCF
ncbi:Actin family [Phytophthora cactorum]|nr:Actin family [Phytophthora cactorum]